MDSKAWLWKKKSTEKTILTDDRANLSTNSNEEEKQLNDKLQHEQDLKILNEKLSVAISECNAREAFAKKQGNLAQEAILGWEKAETEVKTLKFELQKSLQQRVAFEEKNNLLDGALKECMHQLRFVCEDQEKRICDAVKKASKEFETTKFKLDEKLCSLKARAEATEKENTSLWYEVHVLQKELEIRNEEREFNRRTVTASHKHHLENVKRIAKLESECHRLRILVRKRLPGPAALIQMKNEVKLLDKDHQLEATIKTEENDSVKETINKTRNKLQSTLSHHNESVSISSMSELGSDDKVSYTGSWASGFVSDLEQFKDGKEASKTSSISVGFSDMSLMDDFVQMEKLAVVSAENSFDEARDHSIMESNSKEPIPEVLPFHPLSNMSLSYDYVHSENGSGCAIPTSLAEMLQIVLRKCYELQRNPNEMLEEIKAALSLLNNYNSQSCGPKKIIDGSMVKTSLSSSSLMETYNKSIQEKKGNQKPNSNLNVSMHKIIELIEGISMQLPQDCTLETLSTKDERCSNYNHSEISTGYLRRVFQWKSSELSTTLEKFLQACNDLLNEKSDIEHFVEQLMCTLAWVLDHCFSLQDVSSMKYAIKNSFAWDEKSESELDIGAISHEKGPFSSTLASVTIFQNSQFQEEETEDRKEADKLAQDDLITELSKSKNGLIESPKTNRTDDCGNSVATCDNLQFEQVNVDNKEAEDDMEHTRIQLRTDMEITAASEKLAECQETILNLGKQLKALAPPNGNTLSSKVISNPTYPIVTNMAPNHTTLLDKMLAEDNADIEVLRPPNRADNGESSGVNSCSVVTGKKRSGGLLMKLFCSERKGSCKQIDVVKC